MWCSHARNVSLVSSDRFVDFKDRYDFLVDVLVLVWILVHILIGDVILVDGGVLALVCSMILVLVHDF